MNTPTRRYRAWYIPQVPMEPFTVETPDLPTAKIILDTLEQFSLFEYENRVKPDYADAGGIAYLDEDGDWIDVDEDEPENANRVPCCNYRERLDEPCDGTMTLADGALSYECSTCHARCGRQVHPNCFPP